MERTERKMFRQGYRPRRCPSKRRHNQALARHADEWIEPERDRHALVLDDSTWKTTTSLLRFAKTPVKDITVPQHDLQEWRVMSAIVPAKRVHLRPGKLSSFLERPHRYNVVYLDYCCTVNGNQDVRPLRDLRDLMRNATASRMVVAISLCLRGGTETRTKAILEKALRKSRTWSWDEGAGGQPFAAYKRTMGFGIFLLRREIRGDGDDGDDDRSTSDESDEEEEDDDLSTSGESDEEEDDDPKTTSGEDSDEEEKDEEEQLVRADAAVDQEEAVADEQQSLQTMMRHDPVVPAEHVDFSTVHLMAGAGAMAQLRRYLWQTQRDGPRGRLIPASRRRRSTARREQYRRRRYHHRVAVHESCRRRRRFRRQGYGVRRPRTGQGHHDGRPESNSPLREANS